MKGHKNIGEMAAALQAWGGQLAEMAADTGLQKRAEAENEWFTPAMQRLAMEAMLPWFEGNGLEALRAQYPEVGMPRRVGLILAGNLPLVGLHDLLMVLLSGHQAVVKPSSKDRVLIQHLVAGSPPAIRDRVHFVERIAPGDIDFLIATGSNTTAQQVATAYSGVPRCVRRHKYAIAVLDGGETEVELAALADDVLRFHGLGCRSVSALLVPEGYALNGVVAALEAYPGERLATHWARVVRYEAALATMVGELATPCERVVLHYATRLGQGGFGRLDVVPYRDLERVKAQMEAVQEDLQVISTGARMAELGRDWAESKLRLVPFGKAQYPALDDFADGVDTLALLTQI